MHRNRSFFARAKFYTHLSTKKSARTRSLGFGTGAGDGATKVMKIVFSFQEREVFDVHFSRSPQLHEILRAVEVFACVDEGECKLAYNGKPVTDAVVRGWVRLKKSVANVTVDRKTVVHEKSSSGEGRLGDIIFRVKVEEDKTFVVCMNKHARIEKLRETIADEMGWLVSHTHLPEQYRFFGGTLAQHGIRGGNVVRAKHQCNRTRQCRIEGCMPEESQAAVQKKDPPKTAPVIINPLIKKPPHPRRLCRRDAR